jgi:hypothetical protein
MTSFGGQIEALLITYQNKIKFVRVYLIGLGVYGRARHKPRHRGQMGALQFSYGKPCYGII